MFHDPHKLGPYYHTVRNWERGYDDAKAGRAFAAPSLEHYAYSAYQRGYNAYFDRLNADQSR